MGYDISVNVHNIDIWFYHGVRCWFSKRVIDWAAESARNIWPTALLWLEAAKLPNVCQRAIHMRVSIMGVPSNGWFIRENASKVDDLGVTLF